SRGSVATGDFNGDGRLDLAVANHIGVYLAKGGTYQPGGTVSVLLGNGDGSYQPPVPYAVAPDPLALVIGDFDGDGRTDLAVAGNQAEYNGLVPSDHETVSVLLGNGDGTFQPAVRYPAGTSAVSLVAGDFNGDGRPDLVFGIDDYDANGSFQSNSAIGVLIGNGDGTFRPAAKYVLGRHSLGAVVAGDFNGDGRLDVAVAIANGASNYV